MSKNRVQDLFTANLKRFRSERGLTQERLAALVEVTTNHIALLESNRRFPSVRLLQKLSDVFVVDAFEFFLDSKIAASRLDNALKRSLIHDVKERIATVLEDID